MILGASFKVERTLQRGSNQQSTYYDCHQFPHKNTALTIYPTYFKCIWHIPENQAKLIKTFFEEYQQ